MSLVKENYLHREEQIIEFMHIVCKTVGSRTGFIFIGAGFSDFASLIPSCECLGVNLFWSFSLPLDRLRSLHFDFDELPLELIWVLSDVASDSGSLLESSTGGSKSRYLSKELCQRSTN